MFITSGKASLACDVFGAPGEGPNALLIHAGVTDRRSWGPLVDSLAGRRRGATYDARGYGETTYQPETYARYNDALAVLDAQGFTSAAVVGASIGGRTAIDLCLEHPGRVDGLVLIGPAISGAPRNDDYPEPIATLGRLLDAAEESGDLDEVNRLEAHLWLDGPSAAEGRVSGPARDLFLEMNARALAAEDPGDEPRSVDAWTRLEEIAVPVLVLVGTLDLPDIREGCEVLSRRVGDARLVVLDDVAHLPHLEADPRCLREVAGFLDALDNLDRD